MNRTSLIALLVVIVVVVAVAAALAGYYYGRSSTQTSTPTTPTPTPTTVFSTITSTTTTTSTTTITRTPTTTPPQQAYYPVTIEDASNRSVTITSFPSRIVSLAPSDTQDLVALGLGKYIVGVDYYSYQLLELLNATGDLPANVTVFPPSLTINVSGIVALHPSIVVDEIGLLTGQEISELSQAGLLTFYTNADFAPNYIQIAQWISTLGEVFDRNAQAQQVIDWMNQKIAEYEGSGSTTVAYMLYINPDYTFYTAGSGTFINAIIQLAGGVNVFANQSGYPVVTPSNLVLANPQVIFAQEVYNESYTEYMINTMQGITSVAAYKNHHIYIMSENLPTFLLDEPGPLSVYAIGMVKLMIQGQAPTYISTAWVESEFNVTLPVF